MKVDTCGKLSFPTLPMAFNANHTRAEAPRSIQEGGWGNMALRRRDDFEGRCKTV